MVFNRCASQAVRPVNTMTPTIEMTNCSPSDFQNIPTSDASTTPIRPMNANWPTPARLRLVAVP